MPRKADRRRFVDPGDGRGGTALLMLDFQDDFLDPTGRLPIGPGQVDSLVDAARRAVDHASRSSLPVIRIGNEFRRRNVIGNVARHDAAMKGSDGAAWTAGCHPPAPT